MILDSEMQKEQLLALIKAASFPGTALEAALALKQAIQAAHVQSS